MSWCIKRPKDHAESARMGSVKTLELLSTVGGSGGANRLPHISRLTPLRQVH